MKNRAYSILDVKSIDEDLRVIRGVATSPAVDRMGDIIEPLGVSFKNPMPLLWQHKHDKPVGFVEFKKPGKDGIEFEAKLAHLDEPGVLKDRIDEAWQSVKLGLVRAVSIGFRAIEHAFMQDGGIHFLKTEVFELSLVTIPANAEATITSIRSFDQPALLAASGRKQTAVVRLPPAGASASPKAEEATEVNIAERIAALEASRQAKAARMQAILQKGAEEGRSTDASEQEEFDTLESEVETLDSDILRHKSLEKVNKAAAAPVLPAAGREPAAAAAARAPIIQVLNHPKVGKGIGFTRYVMALAAARGDRSQAAEIAKCWKDTQPEIEQILRVPGPVIEKTAVNAGTTTDSTWAAPLVVYQNLASEFIDYLRPLTVIGRIPGLRMVPFKIKIPRQTAGSVSNWVGEGKVKPLSSLSFDTLTMEFFKIAGIIPLTDELVRFSNPATEAIVRKDLAAGIVQLMDRDFLDPAKAEQAGVSPASITNGVSAVVATGTTAAAFRADVKTLFSTMLTNNLQVSGGVWIMPQSTALAMSLMRTALDTAEFPGITMNGGTLLGFPVVTSENAPYTGGSPTDGGYIIFALANEILVADDGGVNIDMSREASLQFETTPDSPTTGTTNMVSLWQHNMIAIKAERYVNWAKARSTAVGLIASAKYSD